MTLAEVVMAESTSYDVPVRGLHCAGCVTRLTKVLTAQPGVLQAEVSLLDGKAHLTLTTDEALTGALAAIEGAGFYPGEPGQGSSVR